MYVLEGGEYTLSEHRAIEPTSNPSPRTHHGHCDDSDVFRITEDHLTRQTLIVCRLVAGRIDESLFRLAMSSVSRL